jgi:hypothetical protein
VADGVAGGGAGGTEFRVSFAREVRAEPASGRLVVWLVKANSPVDLSGQEPADGPFFESPQPMYGVDIKDLSPGKDAVVDNGAVGFPGTLSGLAPGRYKAQAVLDVNRLDSSWRREPGNLYSKVQMIEVKSGETTKYDIKLTEVVRTPTRGAPRGVEYVEAPSELLTKFRGQPVVLKAGVVLPTGYDPRASKRYAAVYEIPGFGGDHTGARMVSAARQGGGFRDVLKECFWITLNPEGPNGHHLFANSANNGPVGDALVQELIPALEKKYRLIAEPPARLLRGHSSGGWSAVWLALTYPETFGAAWASSPDPVDFTHFQIPDIYSDASMYLRAGAPGARDSGEKEIPSFRDSGDARMTIRQENRMEEVLGPDNTSGQQWDSWMAVFGPRNKNGDPAALYDPQTGKLDHAVAEKFRAYDVTDLLRRNPAKYGPLFKERIRVICGEQDSYYLNEAVASLKEELAKVGNMALPEGEHGYVKLVPGKDHGTIFMTREMQAIPTEMMEHLERNGYVGK